MPDITELILADHAWFRERFAALDYLQAATPLDVDAVERVWRPLATRLDLHAVAEERIFYPQLLRQGAEDPVEETLDAIGDHNDIRDGVHDADVAALGSAEWWAAVGRARAANDEHMAEEEREGLSDFRRNAPAGLRESLGEQFRAFFAEHPTTAGVNVSGKDPRQYVETVEEVIATDAGGGSRDDGSLGIGSLRGK
jgi:hypothetical protein